MDWLSFTSNISVILASLTAIYGINAWKREFYGKRKIELAEETLELFYRAQDAIRYIRSPFGSSEEGKTRKATHEESPEVKEIRDSAYVVSERYQLYQNVFAKIKALRYKFKI